MPFILIVNPGAMKPNHLSRTLQRAGFHTLPVTNAQMALAVMRVIRPDLLLVDFLSPDTGAAELVEQLRSDPRWNSTPILLMGGRLDMETFRMRARLGCGEVLEQYECTPSLVLEHVRHFLASPMHAQYADGYSAID